MKQNQYVLHLSSPGDVIANISISCLFLDGDGVIGSYTIPPRDERNWDMSCEKSLNFILPDLKEEQIQEAFLDMQIGCQLVVKNNSDQDIEFDVDVSHVWDSKTEKHKLGKINITAGGNATLHPPVCIDVAKGEQMVVYELTNCTDKSCKYKIHICP